MALPVSSANQRSTMFNQLELVGTKWTLKRGWRFSQRLALMRPVNHMKIDLSSYLSASSLVFRALRQRRPMDAETRALDLAGERLVMERERRRLLAAGRADLAGKVVHTALTEGDGVGFDITSYFADGRIKFVEVKTTTGPKDTDFLTNEVKFSATQPDNYELCRVFRYSSIEDIAAPLLLHPRRYHKAVPAQRH
jgi:Domain of unknown function (DUF3883)